MDNGRWWGRSFSSGRESKRWRDWERRGGKRMKKELRWAFFTYQLHTWKCFALRTCLTKRHEKCTSAILYSILKPSFLLLLWPLSSLSTLLFQLVIVIPHLCSKSSRKHMHVHIHPRDTQATHWLTGCLSGSVTGKDLCCNPSSPGLAWTLCLWNGALWAFLSKL